MKGLYCTLTNSEDPDEMPQNVAFHQGLHFLLGSKQSSGRETHHNLRILTSDPNHPIKYIMDQPFLSNLSVWENPSEHKGLMGTT